MMNGNRRRLALAFRIAAVGVIAILLGSWKLSSAQTPIAQTAVPQQGADGLTAPGDGPSITSKSLLGIIRDGGWVMYPLLLCSFVLLVFAFERAISLRSGRVIPRPFVKRITHQLEEGQLDRD